MTTWHEAFLTLGAIHARRCDEAETNQAWLDALITISWVRRDNGELALTLAGKRALHEMTAQARALAKSPASLSAEAPPLLGSSPERDYSVRLSAKDRPAGSMQAERGH